jgi:hypothetical protein
MELPPTNKKTKELFIDPGWREFQVVLSQEDFCETLGKESGNNITNLSLFHVLCAWSTGCVGDEVDKVIEIMCISRC